MDFFVLSSLSAVPEVNLCTANDFNVFSVHYIIYCIVVAEIRHADARTTRQYKNINCRAADIFRASALDEFMYDFDMFCWRIL